MKRKASILAILFLISTFATAQTVIDLSEDEKNGIKPLIAGPLRSFILSQDGTFNPAYVPMTIDQVTRINDNQVEVTGQLNFSTIDCGNKTAPYKITISREKTGTFAKVCIYVTCSDEVVLGGFPCSSKRPMKKSHAERILTLHFYPQPTLPPSLGIHSLANPPAPAGDSVRDTTDTIMQIEK